ncbi:hypothetical protein OG369_43295 [Streptomyces sp. NBC_01221]|uniref:hypothetical protein n=1 Tax=Streptomyces sp. NBC_01221 TaxID=2903782 RepID=UPI0022569DC8|nr:hypothetical protein [Streptomyces sp. NBC_01221]MCX4792605.1 hypothetical protein [Streptomyces sp. NBC_01221]
MHKPVMRRAVFRPARIGRRAGIALGALLGVAALSLTGFAYYLSVDFSQRAAATVAQIPSCR